MWRGRRKNGGKGTGDKKHKWYVQSRQEEVKNSVGNGEAKEFIGMTHEHELRGWGNTGRRGSAGWKGPMGESGTTVIT